VRSRKASLLAALVAVSTAACATGGMGRALTGSDTSDIQDQLFKLQKDSARILTTIDAMREGGADEGVLATCAEAVTRMEEVERRMVALEEQTLATQRRLDETLSELRAIRRGGGGWNAGYGGTGNAGATAGAWPEKPRTQEGSRPATPRPGAVSAGLAPEDLFNAAYADYSRGKYELALAGFEAARNADPTGPLATDAQHWVGETLFAMGRHLEAASAFDKVIAGDGTGRKVTSAHLKKGLALLEARRTTEGVMELQHVIDTWPDSDEARIAAEYFKRKGIVSP